MGASGRLNPAVPEAGLQLHSQSQQVFFFFFSLMPVQIKYILSDLQGISGNWSVPISPVN